MIAVSNHREWLAMRRIVTTCCACGALAAVSGCAMMMNMRPAADSYTYDVGTATASEIRARTVEILSRFGYTDLMDDGSEPVHMESQWKERAPVDDQEKARGYKIISRVKLAASPKVTSGSPTLYHVLLTVENRYMPSRGTKRDATDMTPAVGYARSIVKEMTGAFGGSARPVTNEPKSF
jgi:hypothetical protein